MLSGLIGWHVMIVLSFWIAPFVLWVIALVQIARSKAAAEAVVVWVVLVTLVPVVGALLWFAIGRQAVQEGRSAEDATT